MPKPLLLLWLGEWCFGRQFHWYNESRPPHHDPRWGQWHLAKLGSLWVYGTRSTYEHPYAARSQHARILLPRGSDSQSSPANCLSWDELKRAVCKWKFVFVTALQSIWNVIRGFLGPWVGNQCYKMCPGLGVSCILLTLWTVSVRTHLGVGSGSWRVLTPPLSPTAFPRFFDISLQQGRSSLKQFHDSMIGLWVRICMFHVFAS